MCGIFAYTGSKEATSTVLNGLAKLDYRGYDSWGIGILHDDSIVVEKHVGNIAKAKPTLPKSSVAIGHTRWATHGSVSETNAHPHSATDNSFILAQNGIVENFEELKAQLIAKGYPFHTQTDTEIIVRLIEEEKKSTSSITTAIRNAFKQLKGRNTIIMLTKSGEIIAARNGSPLVLGVTDDANELFFSSDALSFSSITKSIIVIDNGQIVYSKNGIYTISSIENDETITPKIEHISIENTHADMGSFDHYMIKEIYDSPHVINALINQDKSKYEQLAKAIQKAKTVYTIGSGTAGAAASQMAYYLRYYANVPAISLIGAEAHEYANLFSKDDLIIAPSQSGETADVLEILDITKAKGCTIASFVNMPGSMMTRMSDYPFLADAGPEICVLSTKVFVSQLAWGYLIAQTVSGNYDGGIEDLKELSTTIETFLNTPSNHNQVKTIADYLARVQHVFLLGKGQNLQIIKEGMVKIIEGSYVHAHAIPAGDLKHYAITLMEEGVPVIAVVSNDAVKSDILNAIHEVKARGAMVIGVSSEPFNGFEKTITVPDTGKTSAIMNIIPLQLMAYYMSVKLGHDVDRPRNIAKSVTVK